MKLLDLYCGAGGAAMGYHRAGFDVVGVDVKEQPSYPFEFIQSDVFDLNKSFIDEFDIIHASPPCQAYSIGSIGQRAAGKCYKDLLSKTRELILQHEKSYIIENVKNAPLLKPMKLCGSMFKLRVIRHRFFETDMWIYPPMSKCQHNGAVYSGEYVNVYNSMPVSSYIGGKIISNEERKERSRAYRARVREKYNCGTSKAEYLDWSDAMGIDWMNKQSVAKNKYDLTQAIPPAYTEWIGKLILNS